MSLIWMNWVPVPLRDNREDCEELFYGLWETTQNPTELTCMIYLRDGDQFCSRVNMQKTDEEVPELGIDLLKEPKKKRMKPGEYQAGLRADSWKLDLIQAINEALEYADDRESFIENMEQEGYEVTWADTRKHITSTCPNGRKCRDSSLHDETFLKENLEPGLSRTQQNDCGGMAGYLAE